DEHLHWAARHTGSIEPLGPNADHDRDPDRRLRIGYVSPDFRRHSVAFFIEPIIAAHDRERVEIFCYSDVKQETLDETTARIRERADHWIDVRKFDDEQLARRVREDR